MNFTKYHTLGNTYLVLEEAPHLTAEQIRLICHTHFGIGADGLLVNTTADSTEGFAVRIFNPNGTEAYSSGNGVQVFARYLWDSVAVTEEPFTIQTKTGRMTAQVNHNGRQVRVEMGQVQFDSPITTLSTPGREIIDEPIVVNGVPFQFTAATIGNPHCVIFVEDSSSDLAHTFGPYLASHELFPGRVNVQFVQQLDEHNLKLETWERGGGYTLSTGTGACVAAATAHRLGRCTSPVQVHMPGGKLTVQIQPNHTVHLFGNVQKICEGKLANSFLDLLGLPIPIFL